MIRYIDSLILSAWILICIFLWFNHETISMNNGLGWDGVAYYDLTRNFENNFKEHSFDPYYFQRILLPGIIYVIATSYNKLVSFSDIGNPVELTAEFVIKSFALINLFLLVLSSWIWLKTMNLMGVKPGIKVVGFALLFCSYSVLKNNFYYPVLTDILAFTQGVLLLYFCISNKRVGLLVISILGYFSFPTIFYVGAILFLFDSKVPENNIQLKYLNFPKRFFVVSSVLGLAVAYAVILFFDLYSPTNATPINLKLSILSVPVALLYVYSIAKAMFSEDYVPYVLNAVSIKRVFLVIALFIVLKGLNYYFSDQSKGTLTSVRFLFNILSQSIVNPGTFLVSHVYYYGPFLLLLFIFWNEFLRELKLQTYGYQFVITMYLFMSIGSESRQFINAVPFFVLPLLIALNKYEIKTQFHLALIIVSILLSRFWFDFNVTAFDINHLLEFPEQYYFMNQGPWLSNSMYLAGLAVLVPFFCLVGISVHFYSNKKIIIPFFSKTDLTID